MLTEKSPKICNDLVSMPNFSVTESFELCKQLTKSHYENFSVASWFLPKILRQPFYTVYAYCRLSDDLADEHDGSDVAKHHAVQSLNQWEAMLDNCFQFDKDVPTHWVFIALREVAQQFLLQKKTFADLLVAFRRDQEQFSYATMNELLDYCRYSANPVGRIVLQLFFAAQNPPKQPTTKHWLWSDSICTGLQLANFWQDIARDALLGRQYIPLDVAQRFNVDLDQLQETQSFREMLQELVEDARIRLRYGIPLCDAVPVMFRRDLELFVRGGLAILDAVERNEYNVLSHRPTVSKRTKIRLLWNTWRGKRI